jgi:hypothetical protein
VVFGLFALEDLTGAAARPAIIVIAFTVLLSILAHGLTADPLASHYGSRLTPTPAAVPAGLAEIPARRLIRRSRPPAYPGNKEIKKEIADDNRSGPARGRPRRRVGVPTRMPAN